MPRPITISKHLIINVPIDTFWELVSDTSRINHAMGLPAMRWSDETDADGRVRVIGHTDYLGMHLRWIEHPYEWIAPSYHQVTREFLDQPLIHSLTVGATVIALDATRCEVISTVTLRPRTRSTGLIARAIVAKLVRDHVRQLRRLEQVYAARSSDYFPPTKTPQIDWAVLEQRLELLRSAPVNGGGLEQLLELIQNGRDEDVAQMRPFVLADSWGLERMSVLRMFLFATKAGLLDLHWDILCPNCRVSRDTFSNLRDLTGQSHCDSCRIEYNVNFDDYVELRFSVHPAIRQTNSTTFCAIGGPSYNRHILAQQRLEADEQRLIHVDLPAGTYRARILGSENRCTVELRDDALPTTAQLSISDGGVEPAALALAAGPLTFQVHNHANRSHLLIIERSTWGTPFVSAALVTTMPEFRALFSSEVLAPGLGLAVQNLTILFSDLKNSTPLYEDIGDSSAYALVRDHFDTVFAAISKHGGSIVKTIGDAVMAVFPTPKAGVAAALQMLAGIAADNAKRPAHLPPLIIKLGLHSGPCIAVNANDVLDYFGTTVNAAARAQAVSIGGDVVITKDVMSDPHVQELVAEHTLEIEQFTRDLKGLQRPYELFRLQPVDAALQAGS